MSSSPGIVSNVVNDVSHAFIANPCSMPFTFSRHSQNTTAICSNGLGQLKVLRKRQVQEAHFHPHTILNFNGKVYAGLSFKISISFPPNYPFVAPTIKFDTPCYHPNVDISGGAICLDILQVSFPVRKGTMTVIYTAVGQMVCRL